MAEELEKEKRKSFVNPFRGDRSEFMDKNKYFSGKYLTNHYIFPLKLPLKYYFLAQIFRFNLSDQVESDLTFNPNRCHVRFSVGTSR